MTIELIALSGLPEIQPGDDLAALLEASLAANTAGDGDVVAITQKVVSKAEGRMVPGEERATWVERESVGVVARRGDLTITRTRHGFVCANSGVDASNVREGFLTLLPEDPDASAERLQKELSARLGLTRLGVVITDTFGRPWREGVVDVAIGCAGFPSLRDLRGTADDHGKVLETTVVALADAVAAASGLVMTKTARVPAVLVRGLDPATGDAPPGPASALVRRPEDDLFRESPLVAVAAAQASDVFGPGEIAHEIVEEAVRAALAGPASGEWCFVAVDSAASRRRLLLAATGRDDAVGAARTLIVPCVRVSGGPAPRTEEAILLSAGATIRTLAVALHSQLVGWSWDPNRVFDADAARAALSLGEDWRPMGIVAVGPMPEGGASRPRPPVDPTRALDWRG
ncbi:MAG TPA: coenzyme F420-0:L-glutamate ligase [Actinomycetota bacterium]|nr:coenzyme F420-0:L-glutamate ligase [Actinomycetota bacterium]